MKRAFIAGVLVAAVIALAQKASDGGTKDDGGTGTNVKDAGSRPKFPDGGTIKLDDAKDAGVRLNFCVYKDAAIYKVIDEDGDTFKLDHSPCRKRPKGASRNSCLSLLADAGTRDQGDENVMQDGEWVDNGGCVEVACVIFYGDSAP